MFLIPSFEAVDKTAVEGNAMAAACGCADEVIVVNIATDSKGVAWYNRQKDNVALTTAAENKPAAYIGVTLALVGGAGVVLGAGVTVLVMMIKKKKDSAKA